MLNFGGVAPENEWLEDDQKSFWDSAWKVGFSDDFWMDICQIGNVVHGCILMSLMKRTFLFQVGYVNVELVSYRPNFATDFKIPMCSRYFHQSYLPTLHANRQKMPSTSQSPETGYWNPPPDPGLPFTRNTGVKLTPTGPCWTVEAPGLDGDFHGAPC